MEQNYNLASAFEEIALTMEGSKLTEDFGTLPDLWNYTYKYKYGYYRGESGSPTRHIVKSPYPEWTNKSEMPAVWYKYDENSKPANFKIVSTE